MHWRPLCGLLLSMLLLVGGASFWHAKRGFPQAIVQPATASTSLEPLPLLSQSPNVPALQPTSPLRLTNTATPLSQLVHNRRAVLLENAWLDTSGLARTGQGQVAGPVSGLPLAIPEHLRAPGEPGAYVVQSRGPLDDTFRALLWTSGASIVSYIPNNAYLVRASASAAQQLGANPRTQAVLPYEPYYKLQPALLEIAAAQKPLLPGTELKVLLFPEARAGALEGLRDLGLELLSEEHSPFGPVLHVRAANPRRQSSGIEAASILSALAQLPAVQRIELPHARVLANDLSRARVGVAADSVCRENYLGLTGTNVLVNVNDSGVDDSHADLTNRVFSDHPVSLTDTNGHGTHVAGIIAGSGLESTSVAYASGSVMPAASNQFRGLAPAARLFVMEADPNARPSSSDTYLQETAARTNAFISNNSWHYDNDTTYDLAAASYDAAVRDALPGVSGSQPVLFVFGAGNAGNGADDGTGGSPDSVQSPGTAKNVITVGAIDQPRVITNEAWRCSVVNETNCCQTNQPWLGMTATNNEVAGFSSRGNVGVGIEGEFGRCKPDVVAPGTFVVAARSTQWDVQAYYHPTNDSNYFAVLSNLNSTVGPFYRYESGTSMAAAEVSGVLALMQEFFQRLDRTNSPALMKALLINGARSLSAHYGFQVNATTNSQGWGLINLTNSLHGALTNTDAPASSMLLFDQSSEGALATGQSHTRSISICEAATNQPLRVTLVWTDPPGNPAASLKLVNNLDLVVTNLDTGEVFFGNDFAPGNSVSEPWDTNSAPNLDVVNNVENVHLALPLGTNYSVTIIGRSIAVNAVTTQSHAVAQDYALVVSSGDGAVADALTLTGSTIVSNAVSTVVSLTNTFADGSGNWGALLLNQRAGANTPALDEGVIPWPGGANGLIAPGTLSQWRFYVITNDPCHSNAAFVTFRATDLAILAANASLPNFSNTTAITADIDLYVSTNPALTSLDPAALAEADKSLRRSGTEMLVLNNAGPGPYYIGIKAENEQAAEYAFMGVFSLLPFSAQEPDGSWTLRGINLPAAIPDGSTGRPGTTNVLGLATVPVPIRRVVVTNELWHESFSDLLSTLTHGRTSVVLQSNSLPPVDPVPYEYAYIYEDNGEGDIPGSQPTDGPGSLRNFVGQQGMGVWLLSLADQVPTHTGLVANVSIRLDPEAISNGTQRDLQTNAFTYDFIDVPLGATNLTVQVMNYSGGPLPLQLYVRRGSLPTSNAWDQMLILTPGYGSLSLNASALPPLTLGRYFIGVFNPNDTPQTIRLEAQLGVAPEPVAPVTYSAAVPVPILDDALANASLIVTNGEPIASVEVRVRVDHPRISDMAFTLISPGGTRVTLCENRGGSTSNGLGGLVLITNVFATTTNGGFNSNTNLLQVGYNLGTLYVRYDFYQAPDTMDVKYDDAVIFSTGLVNSNATFSVGFGPGVSSNLVIIMNATNNENPDTRWEYTSWVACPTPGYVWFTEDTNLAQVPIKFAPLPLQATGPNTNLYYLPEGSLSALVGQSAFGTWQLEMWDTRAGATTPPPQLVDWQLQFRFQNTVPTPVGLTYASPATNTIPPGGVAPFYVDVPVWATRVTNRLLYASGPVNLLFNQTNPPTGTNGGDATLMTASTEGAATLSTGGGPPLVPGARYFLGVQNLGTSNVTATLEAVFDIFVNTLTVGVPFANTNSGPGGATDYYLYTVSTNAVRAQFEINGPSADMTLVARKGVPPPTLASYDYISANPGPNDELIVLFDSSNPVPLSPGDWYISAVNVAGEPATYAVRATEFPVYGTNIVITNCAASSDELCLTWTALAGVQYYVQGKTHIDATNWLPVSPTITAVDALPTYCVTLPSPYHFFRVHEGLVLVPYLPPVQISSISMSTNGVFLAWSTPTSNRFRVQWTASLEPPTWSTFTNVLMPSNGAAAFLDDGSESGGLDGPRYYRLQQLP
jgi:subtilisin family serine protease/subtilisin-like proprotein convertase family protein